jgi:hypothetical protein
MRVARACFSGLRFAGSARLDRQRRVRILDCLRTPPERTSLLGFQTLQRRGRRKTKAQRLQRNNQGGFQAPDGTLSLILFN